MGKKKKQRQFEAAERAYQRTKRSPGEQLNKLDQKFGQGIGAVRERARLKILMNPNPTSSSEKKQRKMKKQ